MNRQVHEDIIELMAERGIDDAEDMIIILASVTASLAKTVSDAKEIRELRESYRHTTDEEAIMRALEWRSR
jgi:hypothetical protein